MCADMLVNNFDRTPAIWDHEGNANNLLVDVRADGSVAVWGIDQVLSLSFVANSLCSSP